MNINNKTIQFKCIYFSFYSSQNIFSEFISMPPQQDLSHPINQQSILSDQPKITNQLAQLTPLEKLLHKVNGEGRYQFISFAIFNMLWFVTGWLLLGQAFFYDDEYSCKNLVNRQQCEKYICSLQPLERIDQIAHHSNSIVFEFEFYLICELQYIVTVLTSMIFIGSLLGFFAVPYFADNWGRKIAIRISWFICTIGVLIICISNSPSMIGIGYFLAGFGANPAITLCYSFINEQCLGKSRQRYGVIIQVFYAIGQTTIGLFFIQQFGISWRVIFFIVLGLCVMLNCLLTYLVETPKFLIKKSQKRTLKAFNEIAKKNNKPLLTLQEITELKIQQEIDYDEFNSDDSDSSRYSFSHQSNDSLTEQLKFDLANRLKPQKQVQSASLILLFKYKSLFWKSIGAAAGFLGIQVIYYCTSFNLDKAGYGKLINQEIVGVSEIFGYISAQFVIHCVPRRKTSIIGMSVSGIICLLLAVMNYIQNDENEEILKIMGIVGLVVNRFVLCCFWSIFYVYIAQLFPTKVRSLAFGWASAIGTIGSTLSPYIIFFSKSVNIDSWILPGGIGFLMAIVLLKLPETFGKPSQDFIQEEEEERDK